MLQPVFDGGTSFFIAAHVVAKWIGHSVKVQNDNYAQVDDHHFDQFAAHTAKLVAIQVASKTCEMAKTGEPIEANDLRFKTGTGTLVHCQSLQQGSCVIPAQAGIHTGALDCRLRGNNDPKINV